MRILAALLPAIMLSAAGSAPAQEKKDPAAVYRVEFRIRDGSDAAAKNARRYTMLIDTTGRGVFKVGERVPVAKGSFQPATGGGTVNPVTQFTYLDVGVNIEASVREQEGKILLNSTLDISTIVEHKQQAGSMVLSNPTVAQIRIAVNAVVLLGKPTLVASVDDPVTQRHFEVEALVTKAD